MLLPSDCTPLEVVSGDVSRLNVQSLDELEIDHARQLLFDLAQTRHGQDVRLDLGPVEYLTSTGLGLFLSLHKRVKAAGGRLSLLNVREPVYELFSLTRLTDVLDVRRHEPGDNPLVNASA
jgi:anti-anti-sigma factor